MADGRVGARGRARRRRRPSGTRERCREATRSSASLLGPRPRRPTARAQSTVAQVTGSIERGPQGRPLRRRRRGPGGAAARPGGTPRPTTTRPSTATSSATPASSGARRACDEADAGLLGAGRGPAGARGRLRRRAVLAVAGRRRARRRSASTCPPRQLQHARAARRADRARRVPASSRPTPRALPFARRRPSTWPARRTARVPVRRRLAAAACARWPGCCGPAAAGSSRSPTRCAGPSPTTRARTA